MYFCLVPLFSSYGVWGTRGELVEGRIHRSRDKVHTLRCLSKKKQTQTVNTLFWRNQLSCVFALSRAGCSGPTQPSAVSVPSPPRTHLSTCVHFRFSVALSQCIFWVWGRLAEKCDVDAPPPQRPILSS